MKVVFAGTPDFAATILDALIKNHSKIIAVYTQPDKPKGRGQKLVAPPVKQLALNHNLPVFQPRSLKNLEEQEKLKSLKPDLMIVAAYGLILPQAVLDIPKYGCINVHASLLPKYRGAAPIQYAILNQEKITGVTLMQMSLGLDEGPMLAKAEINIEPTDTSQSLHDKLAVLGADLLVNNLEKIQDLKPVEQDASQATYAGKITKQMAKINWNEPASKIIAKIHGFNPWPVAFTNFQDLTIRIFGAKILNQPTKALPGTIISHSYIEKSAACSNKPIKSLIVATKDHPIAITSLQLPNKKAMRASDLLNSEKYISLLTINSKFD